jgi:hypothetical protein
MEKDAGHLDPEVLMRCADGRLAEADRRVVEEHVESCGICQAELALAREAASCPVGADLGSRSASLRRSFSRRLDLALGARSDVGAPRVRPPRRRWRWLGGGLLAASVAILAVGVHQMESRPAPKDLGRTMRTRSQGDALTLEIVSDARDWHVRLHADESLRDLALRITTAEGEQLLERPVSGEGTTVSREELGQVTLAEVLYVQAVGVDASGNPVRSRPQRLP